MCPQQFHSSSDVAPRELTTRSRGLTTRSRGLTTRSRGLTTRSRGLKTRSRGLKTRSRGLTTRSRGLTTRSRPGWWWESWQGRVELCKRGCACHAGRTAFSSPRGRHGRCTVADNAVTRGHGQLWAVVDKDTQGQCGFVLAARRRYFGVADDSIPRDMSGAMPLGLCGRAVHAQSLVLGRMSIAPQGELVSRRWCGRDTR